MSPVPIIQRQRALSRVGEIRIGGEKPDRGVGRKLDTFRLTSQHKDIIERCASLYGGTPAPWQSPAGNSWQLYTTTSALPVMVIADYSLRQVYEKWESASKCVRRCDGEDEQITGAPCICNTQGLEGKQACDIITRLMVVLPETGTSLGWSLRSTGENAARELSGAIGIAEQLARGRAFVPATLRLTQRRSTIDGQVVRYVVPVLDFNLISEAALTAPAPPDELGYTPAGPRQLEQGVSVAEGIAGANAEPKTRNGRQAAPIPPADDIEFGSAPVPVPGGEQPPHAAAPGDSPADPDGDAASPAAGGRTSEEPKPATQAQKGKLNLLVGRLRKANMIGTEHLWRAVADNRNIDWIAMVKLLGGLDEEMTLHWSPLRESLTRPEAAQLIDRLEQLEAKATA